ncbi:MAG: peptidase S53 [Mycobacterium sp.]
MSVGKRVRVPAAALAGVCAAAVVVAGEPPRPQSPQRIGGPYAELLADSADLGPAREADVQLTAALHDTSRPERLTAWAHQRGLNLRWRAGDSWAILEGSPQALAGALQVDIRDYRSRRGEVFYASPQQPRIPAELGDEVEGLGRILGYTPYREANRWQFPLEVPDQGLTPQTLMRAYNIAPLRDAGFTGKGVTAIVFAFDGFDQADLDTFADTFNLPRFTPDVVGGQPPARRGEANMDLQAIHAVAPDAKKVLVNARPTVEGDGSYEKIATMMEDADRRYPGAVWSFSIGWGCDQLITAADLVPVRAALAAAQKRGTSAFDASGDLAGLECKGGSEWSAPPSTSNIGLDAVASIPEMTNVGGTTLSTDEAGGWQDEQAWFDAPLSQGTAGGVSALYERPTWQADLSVARGEGQRLAPDVSAVADPFTGVKIVFNQQVVVGGGTSLSAPLWAGIAAVINQYLMQRGGTLLGNLNPLLYRVARGARLPAFQDIVRGGNAIDNAGPGFDLVTGLGTPNVDNLAKVLAVTQRISP